MSAHGVLYIHSAPPALCPHIEWAVAGIVGAPVGMPWVGQPAAPGALRAELDWHARPGTAGAIASALAGWNRLRFEVTEDSSPGCDGVRHCYAPDLGLFTAVTGANGDIMVSEDRLRSVMLLAPAGPRAGRWRTSSAGCWARPGTTNSSRSAAPPTAPRSAGSTRRGERKDYQLVGTGMPSL